MSEILQEKIATPATPAANYVSNYIATDGKRKDIDDKGNINTLTADGWRDNNIIINGEFDYAQGQAPATLTTYSSTTGRLFGADLWGMTNENASIQYQRIDTSTTPEVGLNTRYYGKFKKITAAGKIAVSQVFESGNIMHLRGRTARIHVKMKYSIAASMTVRIGLVQLTNAGTIDVIPATFISPFNGAGTDPTMGANLSYIAPKTGLTPEGGSIVTNAVECVLTNQWVRYSGCFDVPSNCKNLVLMVWSNGQLASNDELNVAEVGFYDGMEIRDWFPRLQGDQFARVQRYRWKTFAPDTAPVQNGGLGGAIRDQVAIAGAVATSSTIGVRFPVSMAKAPTAVLYNPAAANAFMRNVGAATDSTAASAANITSEGCDINGTGLAAWVVGQELKIHAMFDSHL